MDVSLTHSLVMQPKTFLALFLLLLSLSLVSLLYFLSLENEKRDQTNLKTNIFFIMFVDDIIFTRFVKTLIGATSIFFLRIKSIN